MSKKAAPVEDEQGAGPRALEVERSVLGAAMLYPEAADYIVDAIPPAVFFRQGHQVLFGIIKALRDANLTVDLVGVKEKLGKKKLDDLGGASYLASLVDGVPRRSNLGHYAAILRDLYAKRELLHWAKDVEISVRETDLSSKAILAEADKTLIALQAGDTHGRMQDLRETSAALMTDLDYRCNHRGELTGVETGFASINQLTGGWNAGDLVVIAARPSVGKSTFAVNTALAAAKSGARVAFFSLEMRRLQLEYRMLSGLSGIPLQRLLGGWLASHDPAWPALSNALAVMHDAPIFIDDTGGRTYWDVRSECRRLRSEGGLQLVVIDYVQLMPGTLDRRGATRNEEVTDISRRLKTMCDELGVCTILLSQLNRGAEGRADPRPKLTDLRESGALEQDADLVCFIHRKNHRESGVNQFIIEKQRQGSTGTVNITLDRDTCLFTDGGETPAPDPVVEQAEKKERQQKMFKRRAHSN